MPFRPPLTDAESNQAQAHSYLYASKQLNPHDFDKKISQDLQMLLSTVMPTV